jgi:hypothetical protein
VFTDEGLHPSRTENGDVEPVSQLGGKGDNTGNVTESLSGTGQRDIHGRSIAARR